MNKKIIINLVLLYIVIFMALPLKAQTYYVDATSGNDIDSGTTVSTPWKTIARVNAANFLPGDFILFKCGESWREELVVPGSGDAVNPITFSQYGSCNSTNKPLLTGSDTASGWSSVSGNIYSTTAGLISQSYNLVENGSLDINSQGWWGYGGVASSWTNTGCTGSGGCIMAVVTSNGAASTKRFKLTPGVSYRLEFRARATSPVNLNAVFNRNSEPWSVAGFSYTATTDWTSYSFDFTPNQNLIAGDVTRIDFSTGAANAGVTYYIDDVVLTRTSVQNDQVEQLYVNGSYMKLAQHPNPDLQQSNDTYLNILTDTTPGSCPAPRQPGDIALNADIDLVLDAAQAADMVGAGIHIRTTRWRINDNTITAYDVLTNSISLENVTQFSICSGWGYYLDNKLWMLDSAGEWYYDAWTDLLYLWMPDSSLPVSGIELSHRNGINVVARAHIVIDGLSIQRTRNGIDMRYSENVTVRNVSINDSHESAIIANDTLNAVIDSSTIQNAVRQGVHIVKSDSILVANNQIINTGTIGSPKKSSGAISGYASVFSEIRNNTINNSGYNGIFVDKDFLVTQNRIYNVCQVLDDCGAIYIGGKSIYSENGVISNNIIVNTGSPVYGIPTPEKGSASQGIYLDSRTDNVTVSGNTVVNADLGIQVHIADSNTMTGNTVYASRKWPVHISENSEMGLSGSDSVFNNQFLNNYLFPVTQQGSYSLSGLYADLDFVSVYDNNRYSALYGDTLVRENLNGVVTSTLAQWQNNRGFDLNSMQFEQFKIASRGLLSVDGSTLISNGAFNTDILSWGAWKGQNEWLTPCVEGGCLKFTRDTSSGSGMIIGNRISVLKNQGYVLNFDLKADLPGLSVVAMVRKAGANGEWYSVGLSRALSADGNWQRYSFPFVATETLIYDSAIAGSGARLDMVLSAAGQSIYIDNVSLQPATVNVNDVADDTAIIINETPVAADFNCPDIDVNKCNNFIRFSNGVPVIWPLTLNAWSSEVIIWAANPMRDTDGDGIIDSSDLCVSSVSGVPAGMNGCSFAQVHDPDNDAVYNSVDNCSQVANADQRDTNSDGFGNICDPDLTNDATPVVSAADYLLLRLLPGLNNADADFNGDGIVSGVDYSIMRVYFNQPPGPGAI